MDEDIYTYEEMEQLLRKRLGVWAEQFWEGEMELKLHLEMSLDFINMGLEEIDVSSFPEKLEEGFYYPYEEEEPEWLDLLLWQATGSGIYALFVNSTDEGERAALGLFRETIERAEEKAWGVFFSEGDDGPDGDGEPIPKPLAA